MTVEQFALAPSRSCAPQRGRLLPGVADVETRVERRCEMTASDDSRACMPSTIYLAPVPGSFQTSILGKPSLTCSGLLRLAQAGWRSGLCHQGNGDPRDK